MAANGSYTILHSNYKRIIIFSPLPKPRKDMENEKKIFVFKVQLMCRWPVAVSEKIIALFTCSIFSTAATRSPSCIARRARSVRSPGSNLRFAPRNVTNSRKEPIPFGMSSFLEFVNTFDSVNFGRTEGKDSVKEKP